MKVIGKNFAARALDDQNESKQKTKSTSPQSRLRSAKKELISHLPKLSSPPDTTARAQHRRPSPKNLNGSRIASNSMLTGVSTALSFGLLASVNNIARLHPNPMIKMVGAHAPVAAGLASAYISHGIQNAFDIISTASSKASIIYDTISPTFIMGTSYAYTLSKLPKFSPISPAGVAATMMVTATGAALGGAITELAAQVWPHDDASKRKQKVVRAPSTLQVGVGRAITQLPATELNKKIAKIAATASVAAVPKKLLLAAPAITAVPFMFRRLVTPTSVRNVKDLTATESTEKK